MVQSVEARVPADRQFLGSLLGGISAGFAASFVRVPTEVIKQRMQTGGASPIPYTPSQKTPQLVVHAVTLQKGLTPPAF